MTTVLLAAKFLRRGWVNRVGSALLPIVFALPMISCVDGVALDDTAPPAGMAKLPIRATYSGPALSNAAINRIRVTVVSDPGAQRLHQEVFDVPDQPEWTLPVSFPLTAPANVIVLVELINFTNGAELIEFSGRLGPFRTVPGVPQSTPAINVFPGPPDNLDITSLTVAGAGTVIEGGSLQLTANVQGGGSNTRVAWTSLDPTIATVSATGLVQTLLPGTARIVAIAGPKSDVGLVNVSRRMSRIELTPATRTVNSIGETSDFAARVLDPRNAEFAGVAVVWTVSDATVAEHLGNGRFRALKAGRVTVTATVQGTPALTASGTLSIEQKVARIEVRPTAVTMDVLGASTTFTASAFDALGSPVTGPAFRWSSSNSSVATIDQSGVATGKAVGNASIKAEIDAVSATATLEVRQKVASIEVSPNEWTFTAINERKQFTAVAKDAAGGIISGKTITWRSSSSSNASVDQTGLVFAQSRGPATIIAEVDGVSGSARITVNPVVGRITFNTNALELTGPGATFQLTASVRDANGSPIAGKTVTWYSQKPSIATVSSDGLVTGVASGTGAISATVDGFVGTVSVVVGTVPVNPGGAAGGDIIIYNDINVFDGTGMRNPNNKLMVRNLVNYSTSLARGTAKTVWQDFGRSSNCTFCSSYAEFDAEIVAAGLTTVDISSSSGTLVSIPAHVKVIVLWLPNVAFTTAEINALKSFAAEGGRVVFVGEHGSFYRGFAIESQVLNDLGTGITVTPDFIDCGFNDLPGSSLRPHQVTTGMTNVTMACSSVLNLTSTTARPIYFDKGNTKVLAASGRINTAPVQAGSIVENSVARPTTTRSTSPADAAGAGLRPRKPTDGERK